MRFFCLWIVLNLLIRSPYHSTPHIECSLARTHTHISLVQFRLAMLLHFLYIFILIHFTESIQNFMQYARGSTLVKLRYYVVRTACTLCLLGKAASATKVPAKTLSKCIIMLSSRSPSLLSLLPVTNFQPGISIPIPSYKHTIYFSVSLFFAVAVIGIVTVSNSNMHK